ncbi:MAG: bifunctional aldehyde dehydrogenase/enoyl-CoA hydratase [Bacteroidota bacterium]
MQKLSNFVKGEWVPYEGEGVVQCNAITGEPMFMVGSEGLDYAAMAEYGRATGGTVLRRMSFRERGLMLKQLALFLHERRKTYYPLSYATGASTIDSWTDIEGGIGTLFSYASLRRRLGDESYLVDQESLRLSKEGNFAGCHVSSPRQGVAIHINAFNFPIWGMLEKLAPTFLAGMPAIVKPSEITSYLTRRMVEDIIASGILPEGALQLVCGKGIGILDPVQSQDVVTFTGSFSTGRLLRAHPAVLDGAVPFNMEADSLNACILGPDAGPGTPEFDMFIQEVYREMVTKAGQKCTAVRRILVPVHLVEPVRDALRTRLAKTVIGDPQAAGVTMGSLVSKGQVEEVRRQLARLEAASEVLYGGDDFEVVGADREGGAFFGPVLLYNDRPYERTETHAVEAFGPVSTILPYERPEAAAVLANMGKGSLVSTIVTGDEQLARRYVLESGAFHGRVLILNRWCGKESTGHGSPLPMLVHGGPGRAGGGEELGGVRGLRHYLQTTAVQGHPTFLTSVTNQYQPGGRQVEKPVHVFRKHFEELEIGETVVTARHTVTEADITNFANVSGDHFYAHMDATALEGTIFTGRVAHGYYILSKAAGLFVEAKKGPVLLNYGIDECRFLKPVYPGTTIGVRLTVKEKIETERKNPEDTDKGIVKFRVDVYDDTGESVAVATILTMFRKKEQANG